jgi:predicted transcriptional regulator
VTEQEMEIVQKVGVAAYSIYSYIKAFPRSRNMDIEVDLNLSDKTVISSLKKLQDFRVIERKMINNKTREIKINSEAVWRL